MADAAVFENRDAETVAVVEEFLAATNRGDVAGMTAVSHDDIVLVGTAPPGGTRYEGLDAVVALWREIFASCPDGRCEVEELIPAGNRCTALLRFVYDPSREDRWVRTVDVFRLEGSKIIEKLAYVKG
jgi:ketosteroid isomerase-like protein